MLVRNNVIEFGSLFSFNHVLVEYVGTSHSVASAGNAYTLQLATWLSVLPHKRYPITDHNNSNGHSLTCHPAAKV
jgi:hypothetical protein